MSRGQALGAAVCAALVLLLAVLLSGGGGAAGGRPDPVANPAPAPAGDTSALLPFCTYPAR